MMRRDDERAGAGADDGWVLGAGTGDDASQPAGAAGGVPGAEQDREKPNRLFEHCAGVQERENPADDDNAVDEIRT